MAIKRELGDRVGEGQILENLAVLRKAHGDVAGALALEGEALRVLETTQAEMAKQKARALVEKWERQVEERRGKSEP